MEVGLHYGERFSCDEVVVLDIFLFVDWMNGWMWRQEEVERMVSSMCHCSRVFEVCSVEFGCGIRCRWATVGVKRTCTTRKWMLLCSWYQKPKPSVNGLVFCDLVPDFVQTLSRCIQTIGLGQELLFSSSKAFCNVAAASQNATLSISCYMIGEKSRGAVQPANSEVFILSGKCDLVASYEAVNPCIIYNYIVESLNLSLFCQKSGFKAVCAAFIFFTLLINLFHFMSLNWKTW